MRKTGSVNYSLTRNKRPYRLVAVVTAMVFALTSISGDFSRGKAGAQHVHTHVDFQDLMLDIGPDAVSSGRIGGKNFILPANLGEITSSYFPGVPSASDVPAPVIRPAEAVRTIIHIQDAHGEYSCQRQIARIIGYLREEYGIESVNLEGGEGAYDLSPFTDIRDPALRGMVADYFLAEGILNGAEYFAVTNPGMVDLWGVEDTDLYLENLYAYRGSLGKRFPAEKALGVLRNTLTEVKRRVYSAELLEMDAEEFKYDSGDIGFREYLSYLVLKAGENRVDVKLFPNVYLLNFAMAKEDNIDFRAASMERDKLLDILRKRLSYYELDRLVEKTVMYREGDIPEGDFYSYLFNRARVAHVDPNEFPELRKYNVYVTVYGSVDRFVVADELSELRSRIMEELFENSTQRELDEVSRDLKVLGDMFAIALTRSGYGYYMRNRDRFDSWKYIDALKREASDRGMEKVSAAELRAIDAYRGEISEFYDLSFKRDDVFLLNAKVPEIRFEAESRLTQAAVLVTGGFHSENLYDIFRRKNIAYVSIIPKFTIEKEKENPYFKMLSGEHPPLAAYMSPAASALAIYSYLCGEASRRVRGLGPEDVRKMVMAVASALTDQRDITVELGPERGEVSFILSAQAPEGIAVSYELVPDVEIDGRKLWALWEKDLAEVSAETFFWTGLLTALRGARSAVAFFARRAVTVAILSVMSFYSAPGFSAPMGEALQPTPQADVLFSLRTAIEERSPVSLRGILGPYGTALDAAVRDVEDLMDWLNRVPGLSEEPAVLETERRLMQVLGTMLMLPEGTLRAYSDADKVVRDLQERGVSLDLNFFDYLSVLLAESGGGHVLRGLPMVLSNQGSHVFPDGVRVSRTGAVSPMQIMPHMAEELDRIIDKGMRGDFEGDTLEETRYFILEGMGITEPIDWERVGADVEYADRIGLALFLIKGFEINRWRVVEGEVLTAGQIRARGLVPEEYPTLGAKAAELAGVYEGTFMAAAYNLGGARVKRLLEDVVADEEGESIFRPGIMPVETRAQGARAFAFRRVAEILYDEKIVDIFVEQDALRVALASLPQDSDTPFETVSAFDGSLEGTRIAGEVSGFRNILAPMGISGMLALLFVSGAVVLMRARRRDVWEALSPREILTSPDDIEPFDPVFEGFAKRYWEGLSSVRSDISPQEEGALFGDSGLAGLVEIADDFRTAGMDEQKKRPFRELLGFLRDSDPRVFQAVITSYSEAIAEETTPEGFIAEGFSPQELARMQLDIDLSSDSVGLDNQGIVSEIAEARRRLLSDEYDLELLGLTPLQRERLENTLRDESAFQWFETIVEDRERYFLGSESAIAVDLAGFIMERQGDSGLPGDLLEEYVLHEALENVVFTDTEGNVLSADEKHHRIINLTSDLFARGDFSVPRETPLGSLLRDFIDEKVHLVDAIKILEGRVENVARRLEETHSPSRFAGLQGVMVSIRHELAELREMYGETAFIREREIFAEIVTLLEVVQDTFADRFRERLESTERSIAELKTKRIPVVMTDGMVPETLNLFKQLQEDLNDIRRAVEQAEAEKILPPETLTDLDDKIQGMQIELATFALRNGEIEYVPAYDKLRDFFAENIYYFDVEPLGGDAFVNELIGKLLETRGWQDQNQRMRRILDDIALLGITFSAQQRREIERMLSEEDVDAAKFQDNPMRLAFEQIGITKEENVGELIKLVSLTSNEMVRTYVNEAGNLRRARDSLGEDISELGATMTVYEVPGLNIIVKFTKPDRIRRFDGTYFSEDTEEIVRKSYKRAQGALGGVFASQLIEGVDTVVVEDEDGSVRTIEIPSGYMIIQEKVKTVNEILKDLETKIAEADEERAEELLALQREIVWRLGWRQVAPRDEWEKMLEAGWEEVVARGVPREEWSGGMGTKNVMVERGVEDNDVIMVNRNYGIPLWVIERYGYQYPYIVGIDADNYVFVDNKTPNRWTMPLLPDQDMADIVMGVILEKYSEKISMGIDIDEGQFVTEVIASVREARLAAEDVAEPDVEASPVLSVSEGLPEGTLYVDCPAGEEIGEEGLGSEFMRDKMMEGMEESDKGLYKNLFGGQRFYSVVIGDAPTDRNGRQILPEKTASARSGVMSALRRWAGVKEFGNITLADYTGFEEAKIAIGKIAEAAGEVEEGVEPANRIKCTISSGIWDRLEESDRNILRDNAMLSIIGDNVESVDDAGNKVRVVYPLPSGRLHNKALTRLNIAHFLETFDDIDHRTDESFHQVLLPLAHAIALVTNDNNPGQIFTDLLDNMGDDPARFFTRSVFRLTLPPVSRVDTNEIVRGFLAEVEVLRSL